MDANERGGKESRGTSDPCNLRIKEKTSAHGDPDWSRLKAVIFDVDGTLYDQRRLRLFMLFEILRHVLGHPSRIKDFLILRKYRAQRELMADKPGAGFEETLLEATAVSCRTDAGQVRRVVSDWIHNRPLRHMAGCRVGDLLEFVAALRRRGIAVAVFSDYPAREKLEALGMIFDAAVSASDPTIDQLKPDPKGLLASCAHLGRLPAECLFIGDREDRDGECARRAKMPYLIFKPGARRQGPFFGSYAELSREVAASTPRI